MCSLCTTICLQWEPEIIAIALMFLAGKLSKFEVDNWTGRTPRHNHWWDMFVEDISIEILEDICHQVLDLYSTPLPETPQDSPPNSPVSTPNALPAANVSNPPGQSTPGIPPNIPPPPQPPVPPNAPLPPVPPQPYSQGTSYRFTGPTATNIPPPPQPPQPPQPPPLPPSNAPNAWEGNYHQYYQNFKNFGNYTGAQGTSYPPPNASFTNSGPPVTGMGIPPAGLAAQQLSSNVPHLNSTMPPVLGHGNPGMPPPPPVMTHGGHINAGQMNVLPGQPMHNPQHLANRKKIKPSHTAY